MFNIHHLKERSLDSMKGLSDKARLHPWWWRMKTYGNIHIQGSKPNIFLFSTARSGSTWLAEIIATQKGIKLINEPELLSKFSHPRSPLPASWDFLMPNPDREDRLESYFRQLIANELGVGSPAPFSRFHRFVSDRIVFKILRCQDLMSWFEEKFQAQIVYLLRHPIPTNLSRVRYDRLPLFLASDVYCERFLTPQLRAFGRSILEHGSELQKKVLDWCLGNLPPLKFLDRRRWLCVHYEELVTNPTATIEKLADFLSLDERERSLRQVAIPSNSVYLSSTETREYLKKAGPEHNRAYLVSRWRKQVFRQEEEDVFEILDRFGITQYAFGHDMPMDRL